MEIYEIVSQKVVAIAYRRWSFTRGSISKAWTGKILVFRIKCLLMAVTGSLMRCGRAWKYDFSIKICHKVSKWKPCKNKATIMSRTEALEKKENAF